MYNRKYNFSPGPAVLPLPVLEKAREDIISFRGSGIGVLEMSHRSKDFDKMYEEVIERFKGFMNIGDNYDIIFMGGGASSQFYLIPMNFLPRERTADYIVTGTWAKKAVKEARLFGNVNIASSSEDRNFSYLPKNHTFSKDPAYIHITSNNTIYGTQWGEYPEIHGTPVVCDMSSDILCKKIDFNAFDLIYAGAQKNIGPAGVTVVIIKNSFLERASADNPTMALYRTHVEKKSVFNTPPVFGIYIINEVLNWMIENGGLSAIEEKNRNKAGMVYGMMDKYPDFYRGHAEKDSRSLMNITFRLPSEDLEAKFIKEATSLDLMGLKGHRSVGGIRVSIYNAFPEDGVEKLVQFMKDFRDNN